MQLSTANDAIPCPFHILRMPMLIETSDLSDNALESVLEPPIDRSQYSTQNAQKKGGILDSLITLDLVGSTNTGLASATLGNTLTRTGHAAVEIHSVNTNRRVVLDAEIDVFADTETKVASLREVAFAKLIFLDLQSTLQNFLSLWSTDGDMYGDLFVTTDTECSDSVAGLACEDYIRPCD